MKAPLRLAAVLGLILLTALALAWSAWNLSGSRRYQLFGELVTRVETTDSVVALTFDDGPNGRHTDAILQLLADSNVRATFFAIGTALSDHPETAARIARAGHELGNHSYSHQRMVLKSPAFVQREIQDTDSLIRSAGYASAIHFRPPYFKRLVVLPWILSRDDRPVILADLEPDSHYRDATRMVEYVRQHVRPGSIILLHVEVPSRAAEREALPGIFGAVHAAGSRFVSVSDLLSRSPPS